MLRSMSRIFLLSTAFFIPASSAPAQEADDAVAAEAAATDSVLLSPITVFGDRQRSGPLDTPTNITVVGEEEIDNRFVNDMQELVRHQPGITVARQTSSTDPFSTFGGFTIRGVGGNRVQMLVDGARVPEWIQDGTRDYLDFNFTKQVHIVRGPASVLWGADALGGIVGLETIDPEDILQGRTAGGQATTAFDSFDNEFNNAVTYARQISPNIQVLAGLAYTTADEPKLGNARPDGGIYGCPRNFAWGAQPCSLFDPTDRESWRGLGKIVATPWEGHRFEFSGDWLSRDTAVEQTHLLGPQYSMVTGLPTGEIIHDRHRNLDLYRGRFAVEHDWAIGGRFVNAAKWSFSYSPNGYERSGVTRSTSAGGDGVITEDYLSYSEDFLELDVQLTSLLTTGPLNHTITWGFDGDRTWSDYQRIDTVHNLTTGTTTQTRGGGFNFANATTTRADFYVQDEIELWDGRLEITPGVRFAHYHLDPRPDADYQPVAGAEPRRVSKDEVLFSLGAMFNINETYSLWAAFNQGFKMPTAQQLYTSLPGAFFDLIPAPDLQPEYVDSYEIGLRGQFDRGWFSVGAFRAEYSDFIESFYNPPGTDDYTYRNIAVVTVQGIEVAGAWQLTDVLRTDFSLAWQEATQRTSPTAVETPHNVPPLTAVLGLAYDVPRFDLTLEAVGTFASAVKRTEPSTNFKPGGYGILDLYAKWLPTANSALRVGIRNVFDTRYFEASAMNYYGTVSASEARANPVELQTGRGRTFTASYTVSF